jgi:hypothetical protein
MSQRAWLTLLLAFGSFSIGTPPSVRADSDETEERLKASGIDDALRIGIQRAIGRGVEFLVKRQRSDATFHDACDTKKYLETQTEGVTLLCALALRHAGSTAAATPVQHVVDWAFSDDRARQPRIEIDVYAASLGVMLLASVPGHEKAARRLVDVLVRGLRPRTSWWDYDTTWKDSPPSEDYQNLSTSQFAVLGLYAAMCKGVAVPVDVWKAHAVSLCARQLASGSWSYLSAAARMRRPDGSVEELSPTGSPTMTAIGVGSLLIAKIALERERDPISRLATPIDQALTRGRAALLRDGIAILDETKVPDQPEVAPGNGIYYDLFTLERACVFGDIERIVDRPWFAEVARWLIAAQRKDGSWAPTGSTQAAVGSEVDTALALLVLERSVSYFRPTTITEPATGKPPTPSVPAPPPPDVAPMGDSQPPTGR